MVQKVKELGFLIEDEETKKKRVNNINNLMEKL